MQTVDNDRCFLFSKIRSQNVAIAQSPLEASLDVGECFHVGVVPFKIATATVGWALSPPPLLNLGWAKSPPYVWERAKRLTLHAFHVFTGTGVDANDVAGVDENWRHKFAAGFNLHWFLHVGCGVAFGRWFTIFNH